MRNPIETFILSATAQQPTEVVRRTCAVFGISRQAVHHHVRALVREGLLNASGNTRGRTYELRTLEHTTAQAALSDSFDEAVLWDDTMAPLMRSVRNNVAHLCHYAFCEAAHNAAAHSRGGRLSVGASLTAVAVELWAIDNGIGIFYRLAAHLGFTSEYDAVMELIKGRASTAPDHHSGDGLFMASQLVDELVIQSGNLTLRRTSQGWALERQKLKRRGTGIHLRVITSSERRVRDVMTANADFLSGRAYEISLPVRLLEHGSRCLVSRAQARRLMRGVDRFSKVELDFDEIVEIGAPFMDEVARALAAAGVVASLHNLSPKARRLFETRLTQTGVQKEKRPTSREPLL